MNQPLAYVHPGAKIAKNVVIEPFTTIHNNVVIVFVLFTYFCIIIHEFYKYN